MNAENYIRTAHSCASDARVAVREFHAAISAPESALVVFFCSSEYDLDAFADEVNRLFVGVPVIGCTTAGEIGPAGLRRNSLSGVAFPAQTYSAVIGHIEHLQQFKADDVSGMVDALKLELSKRGKGVPGSRFAMQWIDGLSNREEPVVNALQHALGDISLFGGSAGDDLKIKRTAVFFDGAFHTDSAVLAIIETAFPFTVFRTHHFVGGQERLVVTQVDTAHRTIKEINGLPAVEEYARVLGVRPDALDEGHFSASPVVVRINGTDYVRSIQRANPDGSLTFYCAIDKGMILRVAHGVDFIGNFQHVFDDIRTRVGPPQLVMACNCIFRYLEMERTCLLEEAESILRDYPVVGFNTYGEQFMGIHINQTLTGIAIGYGEEGRSD